MNSARFQQIEALFHQALALPESQRSGFLAGLDVSCRIDVERLLAADTGSGLVTRIADAFAEPLASPTGGQRLGPWRLLREIGAGGAGVVWLAERADGLYERQAAIKINRGIAGAEAAEQLRHERQVLAALDHPLIASLIDGGETAEGHPYLVMEYVKGEPITQAAAKRVLGLRERVRLLQAIAQAVHYAHQRLIIHRDIKPANVLLREDGEPRLLDFGIAKLFEHEDRAVWPTQPWFTPAYAAPEQKQGGAISTATDIYALGLLLFELLSGEMPTPDAEGKVEPPSRHAARLPWQRELRAELDAIVLRATAPEPTRRYDSAAALADDLSRWLKGRPVHARPDSAWYRVRKFLGRHPWSSAFALSALITILGISYWLSVERARALQAEAKAEAQAASATASADFLMRLFRDTEPALGKPLTLTPIGLLDRGRARLKADRELDPEVRVRLMATLGEMYANLGAVETSSNLLRDAITDAEALRLDRTFLSALWADYGTALTLRARYPEAEAAWREVVRLHGQNANSAEAIAAQLEVVLSLSRQARLAEAGTGFTALQARCAAELGVEHQVCWRVLQAHAEMIAQAGELEKALAESERALLGLRRRLPVDSPDVLASKLMHASILRQNGKLTEAKALLDELLSYREALYDRDSVMLSSAYSELGSVYYEQGDTIAALREFERAVAIGENSLRADDPSLVIDINNLASLLEDRGFHARAEKLFRQALAIIQRYPDSQAGNIGNFRQNLGRVLMLQDKLHEAWPMVSAEIPAGEGEVLAMLRVRRYLQIAEWHRRSAEPDLAESALNQALARVADFGGTEHPRYGALLRAQGLLAEARGDFAAARDWLTRALSHWRQGIGPDYIGCGELELDLARVTLAARQPALARKHFNEAERILRQHLDPRSEAWAKLEAERARYARDSD